MAALRDLGRWKLGTPLEIASTPVRAAHQEEGAGQAGQPLLPSALRDDLVRRALRSSERAGDLLYQADHCQNADGGHVQIGRDGEGTARLPTPAKVEQCQDSGDADGDLDLVAFRPGHGRSQIGGSRGHGYGHSQDVVAQQCRSHEQAGMRPQVGRDDLVVAPTGGVGMNSLPVGGDHHHEHADDRQRHPRGDHRGRASRYGQGDEHLVRCIPH